METLTLVIGNITAVLMLGLGFYVGRRITHSPHEDKASFSPPSLLRSFGRKEKRKPKYVSEEVQWKKEQQQAPLDPEQRYE